MRPIIDLLTENELSLEFIEGLKSRQTDQKFLYIDEGAAIYRASMESKFRSNSNGYVPHSSFVDFVSPHLEKNGRIAVVSLGCGDAEREAGILKLLIAKGYEFSYFGADSSREMLRRTEASFADIADVVDITLLHADITDRGFREKVSQLTSKFARRIFVFFGSTFGNFNQTNITDSFYNLMSKDDLLWFDVSTRPGISSKEDMGIFNRLSTYLKSEESLKFHLYPIFYLKIPLENGFAQLASDKEESVGALQFRFSYVFTQKTVVRFGEEVVHILPNEKIETLTIRIYHPETLIRFFTGHNFDLVRSQVDQLTPDVSKGQFLFKKNA